MRALVGIFVGGASARMGGAPKGLLRVPGGPSIVEHLAAVAVAIVGARAPQESEVEVVLVGAHRTEYASLGLPMLADSPEGVGPLGGLRALMCAAGGRFALALACDMPHVTCRALERLLHGPRDGDVLAARSTSGQWEPFFARYAASRVLPALERALASGRLSLQDVLRELDVRELELDAEARGALRDWDTPEDRNTDPSWRRCP